MWSPRYLACLACRHRRKAPPANPQLAQRTLLRHCTMDQQEALNVAARPEMLRLRTLAFFRNAYNDSQKPGSCMRLDRNQRYCSVLAGQISASHSTQPIVPNRVCKRRSEEHVGFPSCPELSGPHLPYTGTPTERIGHARPPPISGLNFFNTPIHCARTE